MKLTKFEQSGFVIETNEGKHLALDIGVFTALERLEGLSADAMIVSHMHSDHFSVPHIEKLAPRKLYLSEECGSLLPADFLGSEITKIASGEEIDILGIKTKIFEVDHGPNVSVKPKENFGFLFEVDGIKIYFGGDIFYPSGIDVGSLEVDIVLVPVGTFYTFGPREALEFVKKFNKIGKVIPMHYHKTLETKDEFIRIGAEAGFNVVELDEK